MNWTALTLEQLNAASLLGVVESMRTQAEAQGLPDPFAVVVPQVVDELRACIGFTRPAALDQDAAKLPRGLVPLALKKVVREMKLALGTALTDDEAREAKVYEDRLALIRRGEWPIEPADTPVVIPASPAAPVGGFFGSQEVVRL